MSMPISSASISAMRPLASQPLPAQFCPPTAHYVFAGEAGDTITTFEGFGVTLGLSTLSIFVVLARSWNACVLLLILERLRFARGAAW
jgi:hypothetical protein